MKPMYIFMLMWAVFITALSDGISMALGAIPVLGIVLAIVITFCINATMGVGLVFLLISQKMFHPKFGPLGITLGLVPPFNFLPIWVGLVIAGIVHDMRNEKGLVGEIAGAVDNLQSANNPLSKARAAMATANTMRDIQTQRQAQTIAYNKPEETEEKVSRSLPNIKLPNTAPVSADITPRTNPSPQYAQAA